MIDEIELFTRLRHVSGNIQITFYSSKVNSLEQIFFHRQIINFSLILKFSSRNCCSLFRQGFQTPPKCIGSAAKSYSGYRNGAD